MALGTFLTLFAAAPAPAAPLPPVQKLIVSFDVATGLMRGSSYLDIPTNSDATLYWGDLAIDDLIVDSESVAPAPDQTELALKASAGGHRVTIHYHKEWPTTMGPEADGLISPSGIVLTGLWHPMLDRNCRFELSAEVPANFTAVSEAESIDVTETDDGKRYEFRFDQPVPAIHLIAGPYLVERETFGSNRELYTYFFPEDQELARDYRDKTKGYLERYENLLGDYPYRRFAVVENRLPTGYAMPTFTLLGQAVVRLPFITVTSLGHEVLHEWFGNAIEVDRAQGNWAEGLTTYLADHAFAADRGEAVDFRKAQLIKYASYVNDDNALALVDFAGAASHLAPDQEANRAVGYNKCSMVFHMLKNKLGDKAFTAALRDFASRLRFRTAAWDDLRESFERTAHVELGDFFDQWLERSDIPGLSVKDLASREEDGRPVLSFRLVQTTDEPYALTVPIVVKTGEETIRKEVRVSETETEVTIPLAAPPREMVIDPNYDLMRQLAPAELPPVWSRFVGAPAKLAVLADDADDRYQPLIDLLAELDCPVKQASEVTESELANASVVFLGSDTDQVRALFARPAHPGEGATIDIRRNPLNPEAVMVLVTAADRSQMAPVAAKLRHYGKYSYLHFVDGRNEEKRIAATENGMRFIIDEPPRGMLTSESITFDTLVDRMLASRVIYVGETHTSYEDHLLQLRIIRALHNRDPRLAIGMEMFWAADQEALDDYVAERIDEPTFLKRSHYFEHWGFDYRLYRDILRFARRQHLPVIALNIDKTIVSSIFKTGGTGELSDEQRDLLPRDRDLDIEGYRDRIGAVFSIHDTPHGKDMFKGFYQAQAVWDETMAESVAGYLAAHPDERMVVVAGAGHVDKQTAIPPRVARRLTVAQTVVLNAANRAVDPATVDMVLFSSPADLPPAALMGVRLSEGENGVAVAGLSEHGKAKEAGVREKDFILAIDGAPVEAMEDIKIGMLDKKKGDAVRLRVKRPHSLLPDEELEIDIPL